MMRRFMGTWAGLFVLEAVVLATVAVVAWATGSVLPVLIAAIGISMWTARR